MNNHNSKFACLSQKSIVVGEILKSKFGPRYFLRFRIVKRNYLLRQDVPKVAWFSN